MPLRLTANDASLSEHEYDDVVGVRYEYPRRYRGLVRLGEPFVYYRGRRRPDGRTQPQVYLGTGIIGEVHPSERQVDRLVCEIEDWQPFDVPLPFRDADGRYYEPGAERGGMYWRTGVKAIDHDVYGRIVSDAYSRKNAEAVVSPDAVATPATGNAYPSQQTASDVDEYAMDVAMVEASSRWLGYGVHCLPRNNPGFDLLIGPGSSVVRYIEVKGTQLPYPRFFMSEGERAFSECWADRYTLIVIYDIDLKGRRHRVYWHDGPVTRKAFLMATRQWMCETHNRVGGGERSETSL